MAVNRRVSYSSIIALGLLLAGCGGGSGGVSSTPTPAPTPTPISYTKFDDLQGDQTFQTAGVRFFIKNPPVDPMSFGVEKQTVGQGIPVRYLVNPDRIVMSDPEGEGTYTFPVDSYNPSLSTDDTKIYSLAYNNNPLAITTPKVNGVKLTYTRLISYVSSVSGSEYNQINWDLAAFGVLTKQNDLPKNGSASYTTMVSGYVDASSDDFALDGNSDSILTANFGMGTVATTINLAGKGMRTGEVRSFGTLQGSGTISGVSFSGDFQDIEWGGFAGAFFGPQAAEAGYGFFALKGNDMISGVAAGRK